MVIDFTEINHENDIFYKHSNIVLQLVVKLGISNFYTFLDLLGKDEIFNNDIGLMYNTQTFNNIIDYEYVNVLAQDFISLCRSTRELAQGVPIELTTQPWKFMFNACYYLFIPLRINHNSIPEIVQLNNLIKWLNLIYLLPVSKNFISLYQINYLEENKYFATLSNVKTVISIKEKMRDPKNIHSFCAAIYKKATNHTAITFVKCYSVAILNICIDIIKHYCPNIQKYIEMNIAFKGQWLAIDDRLYNKQINMLKTLISRIMCF